MRASPCERGLVRAGPSDVLSMPSRPSEPLGTHSLAMESVPVRPVFARVASDNLGSLKVLQKAGFAITGTEISFANGRNAEIEKRSRASTGPRKPHHPMCRADRAQLSDLGVIAVIRISVSFVIAKPGWLVRRAVAGAISSVRVRRRTPVRRGQGRDRPGVEAVGRGRLRAPPQWTDRQGTCVAGDPEGWCTGAAWCRVWVRAVWR